MIKTIYFLGTSATATTNGTISTSTLSESVDFGLGHSQFNKCNVLINVNTLTAATGNGMNISFRELFSNVGYVETAKSGSITATGQYWLGHDVANSTQTTKQWGSFPALGMGLNKQIVFTNNTIQAESVDIYVVYYQD